MAPRLSGQNCKLFQFLLSLNSQNTQKITPNIEVCPERLGAMSDYNPPINFRVILLATLRHVVQIAGQLSRNNPRPI